MSDRTNFRETMRTLGHEIDEEVESSVWNDEVANLLIDLKAALSKVVYRLNA